MFRFENFFIAFLKSGFIRYTHYFRVENAANENLDVQITEAVNLVQI